MNVTVILIGTGGELDRKTITVREAGTTGVTLGKIADSLEDWVLADGDVLKIEMPEE